MAGFKLISTPDESDIFLAGINGTAVAIGDLLWLPTGSTYYMVAEGTDPLEDWQWKAVAAEAGTTASSSIKAIFVHPQQIWEVESANNSNTDHNGDRMVLTDQNTVNNTGTNSTDSISAVIQTGIAGAASDKRIL